MVALAALGKVVSSHPSSVLFGPLDKALNHSLSSNRLVIFSKPLLFVKGHELQPQSDTVPLKPY